MVAAIIVTYQPDLEKLFELLRALAPQVDCIVLVDNGSSIDVIQSIEKARFVAIDAIALERNFGIAAAQNIGIARARELGADYVLLSDQDSVPHCSMVRELLVAAEKVQATGQKMACVGPRYLDDRQQNPPPFIRIRGLKLERCSCSTENAIVPVDYLIASGCLIPMAVLEEVGDMREDFFIDYVDIEWGLRAKYLGFQSYGVCAANMIHSLGDQPIEFFGKKVPLHSPLRHYYHFRNAVWMYRQALLPLNWKLVDGWRLILKYGFYTLFATPRLEHFKMMSLGVWHGLRGRMGMFGS